MSIFTRNLFNEWQGFTAVYRREMIRFWRQKARIVTSFVTPFLWLAIIGTGFSGITHLGNISYESFLLPGIVAQTVLFASIFFGVSIIMDKQFGFLREMLVAPISRTTVFLGKAAGGMTVATLQAILIVALAIPFNVPVTIWGGLLAVALSALTALVFTSAGLILGKAMDSMESFNLVMSFLVMPAFFLSGALFPTNTLPDWAKILTAIDPLSYAVDGIRNAMIGISQNHLSTDIAVLAVVAVVLIVIGTAQFKQKG